jgi:hypothetical protein
MALKRCGALRISDWKREYRAVNYDLVVMLEEWHRTKMKDAKNSMAMANTAKSHQSPLPRIYHRKVLRS